MRLAAQLRGGFYLAHPNAIVLAATCLRPPRQDNPAPCSTRVPVKAPPSRSSPQRTFAIELDDGRAQALHATLPTARVLAPASCFGCRASGSSFSFVWLNPPFDHGYGGHRVEEQFLLQATEWLMPGGVLALVCPEDVAAEPQPSRRC